MGPVSEVGTRAGRGQSTGEVEVRLMKQSPGLGRHLLPHCFLQSGRTAAPTSLPSPAVAQAKAQGDYMPPSLLLASPSQEVI